MACSLAELQQYSNSPRRMDGLRYGELVLSSIVLAELQFMVAKSAVPQAKREQLLRLRPSDSPG
jgi:predicted nucleic acid-binding protein